MDQQFTQSITPDKLDLVMRENEFTIYYDSSPLKTLAGNEVSHPDSRLLKHILIKLTLSKEINFTGINTFNIFAFYLDSTVSKLDLIGSEIVGFLDDDPILKSRFKARQRKLFNLEPILEYLENNAHVVNLMFWGVSAIGEGFQDLISEIGNTPLGDKKLLEDQVAIEKLVSEKYLSLSTEKRAAINLLSMAHSNGLMLPMMLVLQKISPSEYSTATLAIHSNKFLHIEKDLMGLKPEYCRIKPVEIKWNRPEEAFRSFYEQAIRVVEFTGFFEGSRSKISVIGELINQGENDTMEFKSTFRWDIRQNKKNPAIEHAALKSMAAFMNSEGGDLLLGVADDGSIVGIETDNFPNDDKFLLHVWSLIKSSMGQDISMYLTTTLEKIHGKTVCRVHCKKSQKPVFLRQSGFDEAFYIRIGPSSGSLEISEALKYIAGRF